MKDKTQIIWLQSLLFGHIEGGIDTDFKTVTANVICVSKIYDGAGHCDWHLPITAKAKITGEFVDGLFTGGNVGITREHSCCGEETQITFQFSVFGTGLSGRVVTIDIESPIPNYHRFRLYLDIPTARGINPYQCAVEEMRKQLYYTKIFTV